MGKSIRYVKPKTRWRDISSSPQPNERSCCQADNKGFSGIALVGRAPTSRRRDSWRRRNVPYSRSRNAAAGPWPATRRRSTANSWNNSLNSWSSEMHPNHQMTTPGCPLLQLDATASPTTPEESIELAYLGLREQLAQELLSRILACSPTFFEQLVVELLVKMGYGGSRRDAGERIGQTGDGGIDGIIKEDRLGLDLIFIQAKRWQGSVGRPEIQKFVGALQGQRARKGVFITTSTYTPDAIDYASRIDTKVVLIDGKHLSALMIDFDVGVSVSASYVVKRVDSDYFEES